MNGFKDLCVKNIWEKKADLFSGDLYIRATNNFRQAKLRRFFSN